MGMFHTNVCISAAVWQVIIAASYNVIKKSQFRGNAMRKERQKTMPMLQSSSLNLQRNKVSIDILT